MSENSVRLGMIGCGGMSRNHIRSILQQQETTTIPIVCEPSGEAYEATCEHFEEAGQKVPINEPDLEKLLTKHSDDLDAVFIVTPHVMHHDQTKACMEAGLDVLLEKPMVMNADEAKSLIETRDRTDRLLVVSFNGSLSPQIRTATKMLRNGELGEILNIHAVVWQNWKENTVDTWRQNPAVSGGGFLFDTGAHLLNTVSDLAGEDFVEVTAWLDNRGTPVDIIGSVMARLASGALITLSGCGEAILSCHSDVRVFCTDGILRTGVWGERLEIQREGDEGLSPVDVPPSMGQWEQFLRVRNGEMENPCQPEIGLRMARLWDAVQESAAKGGQLVQCGS